MTSLFSLSVEEATREQDLYIYFNREEEDSITFCGSSTALFFRARLVDGTSVVAYEPCPVDYIPSSETITIPRITLTTLRAVIESTCANIVKLQLGSAQFSSRFKERLERLLK